MNDIKAAVNQPELLGPYIEVAIDLYGKKQDGARWGLDELSFGEWACLAGIREGLERGREEKSNRRQAQQDAMMQRLMHR